MNPRITAVAVLIFGIAALSGCQSGPKQRETAPPPIIRTTRATETQQTTIMQAQAALASGRHDDALGIFNDILAENPMVTVAYIGVGDVHMAKSDYEKAEKAYERATRLEPGNFNAQSNHGLALQLLGRFVEAVRAYHRALTIQPDDPETNLNLATTFLQMEQARSALPFAEKAVKFDPDNGSARANLGAVYETLGQNEEAIQQYVLAMEFLEPSPELMLNLVNVLAREKRYREAANTAETLVQLQPSANAYERLGWSFFRLREHRDAKNAYRMAVELDETHWPSWNGIGVISLNSWILSGNQNTFAIDDAREAFRQSLRINANQPKVIKLMSRYNLL